MIDWKKVISADAKLKARREDVLEQIRQRRDRAIEAGISVAGIPVPTDDKTQNRIMGAAMAAMLDPDYSVLWKADDGMFIRLSGSEVIGVANQVRAHVQACYDREAELRQAVAAGQLPDAQAGWPGAGVVRVHADRVEEPGRKFGLIFAQTGTGIYRLSGHPDLANAAGDILAPRNEQGDPIASITATWSDGALSIWVTRDGDLADIPAGRWMTLNLEPAQ